MEDKIWIYQFQHIYNNTLFLSSQGKEDFIEECVSFDDSFSVNDWIDGFECIAISLSCEACNFTEENWAVIETM